MNRTHVSRLGIAAGAVSFAGIGAAFLIAPAATAARLGLEATGSQGLVSLRADLGGLFLGLAVVCAAALWTRKRAWMLSAAAVLGAVAVGRLIGWASDGIPSPGNVAALGLEVGIAGMLVFGGRPRRESGAPAPRRKLWPIVTGTGTLASVALFGVLMLSSGVQQWIFDRAAERLSSTVNDAPLRDDAMRVAVCGTSAPLPSAQRAKACVAVFAGGKFYVVDSGPESTESLVLWGIPLSQIGGVLLTHFHSDHIGDLGELSLQTWAGGRPGPLAVYGGPGIEGVVAGFNAAYTLDQGYRTEHHGESVMPSAAWPMVAHTVEMDGEPTPAKDRTGLVLDDGELRITAIEVNHAPIEPAYAYRFDYKGRSVVITGDLTYHEPLTRAAMGADVLVSEAIAVNMTRALGRGAESANRSNTAAVMHDIEDYHITPEQAAKIANDANVRLLVYYHLLPTPDGFLARRVFSQGVDAVRPDGWTIADDGSMYTLPIGSEVVEIGDVMD